MTGERTIDGSIGHQSFGHQPSIHRFIAGRPTRDAVSVMCERARRREPHSPGLFANISPGARRGEATLGVEDLTRWRPSPTRHCAVTEELSRLRCGSPFIVSEIGFAESAGILRGAGNTSWFQRVLFAQEESSVSLAFLRPSVAVSLARPSRLKRTRRTVRTLA
jgi:hypothetical protein